jgi:eukaryotic-like serine/threonine-protein kinase
MPLPIGARLGPYEILAVIGAGGMGEVYRAHDSRLRRDVAIKVLPAALSADADRLRRFEQEALATAALNHPNILAVYDIGTGSGAPFIVSELLEGETLRERLLAGAMPVRKAIGYAAAIARGLAAAHEKGITHRDLKPENVFVTTDDRIKILDFGLAKLTATQSPALSSAVHTAAAPTEVGLVLGTVGYMAPEQVRGLPIDHRADLFALGAVLYELLSGARPFRRDTAPETMTAILNDDPPDLSTSARPVAPALSRVVGRCLEKNPSARFQTAADLAFALEALSDVSAVAKPAGGGTRTASGAWLPWTVAVLLLVTLAPFAYQHARERPVASMPMRFQVAPTVALAEPANFSVSPDGRHLAFFGRGADGIARLWIRSMDLLEARPLPGSEIFGPSPPPIWSPDSRFVAIDVGRKLKKLEVSGGPPQTLCDLNGVAVGGAWNREGDIIIGNTAGGLLRVRDTGGVASEVTTLDRSRKEEFHLLPSFLPDGRHFVYLRVSPGVPVIGGTYIGTLDAKAGEQSLQPLLPYQVGMAYVGSDDANRGHLMFVREGTLMAQPFDAARLSLAGDAVPVAEHVGSFRDGGFFSASTSGLLVYRTDSDSQVTWFDRQGNVSGRVSEPGRFRSVALSPDGTRAAASRTDPQDGAKADLWILDLSRGSGAARLTVGDGLAESPLWSRDGKRVAFTVNHNVVRQKLASAEGDETELLQSLTAGILTANDWSPDGRFLLYSHYAESTALDLSVLPRDGGKGVPFMRTPFVEDQGRFSPDGRWVAFVSNQSGAFEVYVRAFTSDFSGGSAGAGGSMLISRGGGTAPRWRRDGRELFYLAADGKMMAVAVKASASAELTTGTPTPLFQTPPATIVGDVAADGTRFLLVTPVGQSASTPFTVLLNWTNGLKK